MKPEGMYVQVIKVFQDEFFSVNITAKNSPRTIWNVSVFQLTVVQGDIVNIAADAIVHPTNATYQFAGEVGK